MCLSRYHDPVTQDNPQLAWLCLMLIKTAPRSSKTHAKKKKKYKYNTVVLGRFSTSPQEVCWFLTPIWRSR